MSEAPVPAEGEMVAVEVDGTRVAVANVGGELYAFDEVCTHRSCLLSDGVLDGVTVTCPCHEGVFDVRSGEVVGGPPPRPVRTYRARVEDGRLVVDL